MPKTLRVIPFGTSAGIPTRNRMVSSLAIDFESCWILLDCGEGAQIRLMDSPLKAGRLEAIFITHLHGDHLFGLPGLLSSFSIAGRTQPLHVLGPNGIREYLSKTTSPPHTSLQYPFEVHEIQPGFVYETKRYRVSCLPLDHVIEDYGFLVEEMTAPFRKIAYCTDTRPTENSLKLAENVDLLIHEATFANDLAEKADGSGHSTAADAARIAKKSGCDRLLLTHFSPRYKQLDVLLEEAREIFEKTDAARDLDEIQIIKRQNAEDPRVLTQGRTPVANDPRQIRHG